MNKNRILLNLIYKSEGGYANVEGDSGGETYKGISRKWFPKWEGWKIIDEYKPLKRNQFITTSSALDDYIDDFYKKEFLNKLKTDSISSLFICGHLADHAVNCGIKPAIKVLQRAIKATYNCGNDFIIDGIIGNKTLHYCNHLGKYIELENEICNARKNYYKDIVDDNPSQNKFLKGWLNRVDNTSEYLENFM